MNGLRQKLVLSHVGLVALAMALAGLYVLQQMEAFYLDNLLVNLEARAAVTASYLRDELTAKRFEQLQSALRDRDTRHATHQNRKPPRSWGPCCATPQAPPFWAARRSSAFRTTPPPTAPSQRR
ncbi:MAG: hypothetical protein NTZ05_06900 [Chloroflexi bacterium]|nr:hypothetical protein [Chloroflexota bacterium]